MRQKRVFSASFNGRVVNDDTTRSTRAFSDISEIDTEHVERDRKEFMTPTIIKMMLVEMKRRPNIRFLRLIKSAKIAANQMRNVEDLQNLKKILIKELSFMLSEYADMLTANPSLQLNTYFRINSAVPQASDEGRQLSRVMIRANKIKLSTGYLPPKNQRDLSSAMDSFIQATIDSITNGVDVLTPILNDPTE